MTLRAAMDAMHSPELAERTLGDPVRMVAALRALWQPIATAPMDARVVLYRPSAPKATVVMGWYCSANKRPYWTHDLESLLGIKEARRHQPTHWCPIYPPLTHE
jgi:hypothetical protein